ncbi:MAG: transaldolase / glucose-6-phosphate isomerase [Solirubrobacteraceae bacterium]|nr:transaldolase / glucose-6-phosphate isomerase [Solirubrobacteraceae bacterium]
MSDAALTVEARIPASLRAAIAEQLDLAAQARVAERVREGDATLWGPPGAPEIADRLGWLTVAERMLDQVDSLTAFADKLRDDGLRDVVLLGMGGSSLAPEVLRRSFGSQPGHPRLHVLDSTDAATVRAVEQSVEPKQTLFLVSSKSGGTIEPLSLFAYFWSLVGDGQNFAAITDPGSGLEELAHEHGFREVFAGDPDIGGRYSALSAFGIVPAALIGVDIRGLLLRASLAWETELQEVSADAPDSSTPAEQSAGVWMGAALSALARAGRDKLTFVISHSLPGLGLWLEQLVAESTGKRSTGILPVAEEPLGEPGDYGDDRVFAYLPDAHSADAELDARVERLAAAGHPLLKIPAAGPSDLGRLFMLSEVAVAVAGWGLAINPFDQPNVQQAKDATKRVLAEYEARHELPEPPSADQAALHSLIAPAAPPSYLAIMGYVQPSGEFDAAIAELRVAIRAARKATTTFGYGPRFLHSTGQFHKGGPKSGRFLQLLHDAPEDVDIPGAPYTFATLKNAEAIGDLDTLRELGLPAERVRLNGDDAARALRDLTKSIEEAL